MCIICVELVKQRMSIPEAERNVSELVVTDSFGEKFEKQHVMDLKDAVGEMDIDKLDRVIEEGLEKENETSSY